MSSSSNPAHLEPSKLGTKEYWDAAYTTELTNHTTNPTDTGHVWFSESDAEGRVTRYLETLSDEGRLDQARTTFLDLGTGNGSMVFALADEGWRGEMVGVDYSEGSVELARRVLGRRRDEREDGQEEEEGGEDGEDGVVRFETWDLLEGEYVDTIWPATNETTDANTTSEETRGWDVVLDKGTFDAISLSGQVDAQGRRIVEGYRSRVKPLVKRNGGLLIVTSCNWTSDELEKWFAGTPAGTEEDGGFEVFGRVKYPSYRFGGQEGQTISTVCFKRT